MPYTEAKTYSVEIIALATNQLALGNSFVLYRVPSADDDDVDGGGNAAVGSQQSRDASLKQRRRRDEISLIASMFTGRRIFIKLAFNYSSVAVKQTYFSPVAVSLAAFDKRLLDGEAGTSVTGGRHKRFRRNENWTQFFREPKRGLSSRYTNARAC